MPKRYTRKNKRHKIRRHRVKRGGDDNDIEMGKVQKVEYMKKVPADPERFNEYERKERERLLARPASPEEVTAFFNRPNPEEQRKIEQKMMFNEDPLYENPYDTQEFTIFGSNDKGGKSRRRNRRKNISRRRRHNRN